MNRHVDDSYKILNRIDGLGPIAEWAWMHHEKLDGSGYPRGLKGAETPQEARFLAVADIFHALLQNRPYRASLSDTQALDILYSMTNDGHIDEDMVDLIAMNSEEFHAIAFDPIDDAPTGTMAPPMKPVTPRAL